MKRTIILRAMIMLLVPAGLLCGCSNKPASYGRAIEGREVTRIGEVLSSPGRFEGKTVMIKGLIEKECPAGCWFKLKDDTATIHVNIHPNNFVIPPATGRQTAVEGTVKKDGMNVSLIGSGVEIK